MTISDENRLEAMRLARRERCNVEVLHSNKYIQGRDPLGAVHN